MTDPLSDGDFIQFSDLLELYISCGKPGALAVNIRPDDLRSTTPPLLADLGGDDAAIDHGFDVFTRRSGPELIRFVRTEAAGV